VPEPSAPAARKAGGLRVKIWELAVYTVLVAAAAYWAGHRAGREKAPNAAGVAAMESAAEASPHGMAQETPMPSGSPPKPSMALGQMRANLAKINDAGELVAIANQHLDNATSLEKQGRTDAAPMLYQIAVAAYERALELQPKDPKLLTDLGIAYRGLGSPQAAIARFREAAAADPKHLESRYNLGVVLLNDLHQPVEAKKAWEEYLRVAPKDDPNRREVESGLQKLGS